MKYIITLLFLSVAAISNAQTTAVSFNNTGSPIRIGNSLIGYQREGIATPVGSTLSGHMSFFESKDKLGIVEDGDTMYATIPSQSEFETLYLVNDGPITSLSYGHGNISTNNSAWSSKAWNSLVSIDSATGLLHLSQSVALNGQTNIGPLYIPASISFSGMFSKDGQIGTVVAGDTFYLASSPNTSQLTLTALTGNTVINSGIVSQSAVFGQLISGTPVQLGNTSETEQHDVENAVFYRSDDSKFITLSSGTMPTTSTDFALLTSSTTSPFNRNGSISISQWGLERYGLKVDSNGAIIGYLDCTQHPITIQASLIQTSAPFQDRALISSATGFAVSNNGIQGLSIPSNTLGYFSSTGLGGARILISDQEPQGAHGFAGIDLVENAVTNSIQTLPVNTYGRGTFLFLAQNSNLIYNLTSGPDGAPGSVDFSFDGHNFLTVDPSGSLLIGTNVPDPSAILVVKSDDKAVQFPTMTSAQRRAIPHPKNGYQVFDTDLQTLCCYAHHRWNEVPLIPIDEKIPTTKL